MRRRWEMKCREVGPGMPFRLSMAAFIDGNAPVSSRAKHCARDDNLACFSETLRIMTPEQNELITRVGPGTKCGALMRHYWHPVALTDELDGERPAKAVRVLGQDFVLFRDQRGRYGLLDRHCPHRGADLAYGRLEDGGLRCLFHGWLFDT